MNQFPLFLHIKRNSCDISILQRSQAECLGEDRIVTDDDDQPAPTQFDGLNGIAQVGHPAGMTRDLVNLLLLAHDTRLGDDHSDVCRASRQARHHVRVAVANGSR
ncbi:unannotated protein [freshwater metagenome]|uniref:Unannotated protein n=1 Tax=freshwater metagenome TaxID=449393 RepID=A0A6J6XRX8_9ZZZZ